MTKANEIKNLFNAYMAAKANTIAMYNATDEEFDAALDAECEAQDTLAAALVEFTRGAISEKDANLMICRKESELASLINRLAA